MHANIGFFFLSKNRVEDGGSVGIEKAINPSLSHMGTAWGAECMLAVKGICRCILFFFFNHTKLVGVFVSFPSERG